MDKDFDIYPRTKKQFNETRFVGKHYGLTFERRMRRE